MPVTYSFVFEHFLHLQINQLHCLSWHYDHIMSKIIAIKILKGYFVQKLLSRHTGLIHAFVCVTA